MRIKTILLAVGLTWIAPLAHAQRPGSAPAVSNRPSLMPCRIVERIEGSLTNVIGLPIEALRNALERW